MAHTPAFCLTALALAGFAIAQDPVHEAPSKPAELTAEWLFFTTVERPPQKTGGRWAGRDSMRKMARKPKASELTKQVSKSLDLGFRYIARSQQADGRWSNSEARTKKTGPRDVGTTGLALQALFVDGNTLNRGEHEKKVRAGVLWLLRGQHENGSLVDPDSPFSVEDHIHATTALIEIVGMSKGFERPRPYVQRAIDYALGLRRDGLWWSAEDDPSATGHAFPMLINAEAFFKLDKTFGSEAVDALSSRADSDRLLAMALFGRIAYLDEKDEDQKRQINSLANRVAATHPQWKPKGEGVDYVTALFGARAMYQTPHRWHKWAKKSLPTVAAAQVRSAGKRSGSWLPVADAKQGGRVFATALGLSTMQSYFRFQHFAPRSPWLFRTKKKRK